MMTTQTQLPATPTAEPAPSSTPAGDRWRELSRLITVHGLPCDEMILHQFGGSTTVRLTSGRLADVDAWAAALDSRAGHEDRVWPGSETLAAWHDYTFTVRPWVGGELRVLCAVEHRAGGAR